MSRDTRDSPKRPLTISLSSLAKSSDMKGCIVFISASGVLGERKLTLTPGPVDWMKEYPVPSAGFQTYSGFEYEVVRAGTISENTSNFSIIFAGVMSPAMMMACSFGCAAIRSNIIRMVVSDASWSNTGTLSNRKMVASPSYEMYPSGRHPMPFRERNLYGMVLLKWGRFASSFRAARVSAEPFLTRAKSATPFMAESVTR